MEKNINKNIFIASIIISILLIASVTTYKVMKRHNEKVLLVEEKYIIESAIKCLNDKKCNSDTITLKELYDLDYLEPQVNEVTKEYYNEESYIKKDESGFKFIVL